MPTGFGVPGDELLADGLATIGESLSDATPRVVAGLLFLGIALVGVRALLLVISRALHRVFPEENDVLYRRVAYTVISVFLWFGVGLTFLSIVGLQELAAALGTASGFLALGVSYALKDVVKDAVAGVYLLRDPDFLPGDTVTVDGVTGEIEAIELRKTRLRVDGDVVVRANGSIEGKWTKHTTE